MERITNKRCLIVIVLVAASCIRPTNGLFGMPDFLELGQCLNATLFDGFDPVKYQGLWFDIKRVPNEYQLSTQCNSMNYTWAGDRMISVSKGLTDAGKKVKQVSELHEELELRDPPHPAHMTVIDDGVPESPYQVISTDYVTYSCVHSCLEYFAFKGEFLWVLGRTPYLPPDYVRLCYDAFTKMGVDPTKLKAAPQGEFCPYIEKLDQILEENRQVMTRLGLPDTPVVVPPWKDVQEEMVDVERVGMMEVKPRDGQPVPPQTQGEKFLNVSFDYHPLGTTYSSAAPLKISNTVIPLFILVAILLPVVVR